MSEQDKRAEEVAEELMKPQSHMEVSLDPYSPAREKRRVVAIIAAALEQAASVGYRLGVEAALAGGKLTAVWPETWLPAGGGLADYCLGARISYPGLVARDVAARLLSERLCILCKVPLVVGPPTCPRCGGHAWKEDEK